MAELMITPAEIAALHPCADRLLVYRAAHPTEAAHPFVDLLDCNGLKDALWVLDRLPGPIALRLRLRFGAACAERALHLFETAYPDDPRPRQAIRAARAYAEAVGTAGEAAARAAAQFAWAAAQFAWAAAGAAEREAQASLLRELVARTTLTGGTDGEV